MPGVVDTMVTLPRDDAGWQRSFAGLLKDAGSAGLAHPAGYMFHDIPSIGSADPIAFVLAEMDRYGVDTGVVTAGFDDEWSCRAVQEHPDRFVGCALVDPNAGVAGLRRYRDLVGASMVRAAAFFPAGTQPQVGLTDAAAHAVYATCVELGTPLFVNVGVPGPRVPMGGQHVAGLDEVCRHFPELVVITRHGGEPWADLLVALMRTWPNLYTSTSAFAPRYYPSAIMDYANADGTDRVLYAGYFTSGLSYARIFTELPDVPLTPAARAAFLEGNARRLGLGAP